MTEAELKKQIKSGLSGAYFFIGEEEYLKRHYRSEMIKALCGDAAGDNESLKSFNFHSLDMREKTFEFVKDAIASPPFMSEKKLVEICGIDYNNAKEGVFEAITELSGEAERGGDTILLFYALAGELDTVSYKSKPLERVRKKLSDRVKEVLFEYSTPAKLSAWIERHFAKEGISAAPSVPGYLIDRCGNSMDTLDGEIIKLTCRAKALSRNAVTTEDVDAVCAASDKESAFALSNALLDRNIDAAFEALRVLRDADEKPTVVLSKITRVYADLLCVKEIAESGGVMAVVSKLKINEYKAKLYAKAAAGYTAKRLEGILRDCIAADIELKSRAADFLPVERLLCTAASGGRYGEA